MCLCLYFWFVSVPEEEDNKIFESKSILKYFTLYFPLYYLTLKVIPSTIKAKA